jgi:hypothetical protein
VVRPQLAFLPDRDGSMTRRIFLAALAFAVGASLACEAAEAIKPVSSSAAEASHVFCSKPCFLRSVYVTTGASAGYLMTINATTTPIDGAVAPVECVPVAANSVVGLDFGDTSDVYNIGLSVVFSTTGCFTKTASATAFFKARVQP